MRILAVGAHPDDIEIGAGALIAKARELGHPVAFLILTDEDGCGDRRRAEAVRAAAELGVARRHVLFAGLRDGHLRADAAVVDRIRRLLRQHRIAPDVVVTHTQADSHNDHVEANRIAHAVFRDTAFLHFSVHISAEPDRFSPRVFVHVTPQRLARKDQALRCYATQQPRMDRLDLATYEAGLGRLARLARAEGFETSVQYGTADALRKSVGLSDSPFHRFWQPVVADGTLTLLYGAEHRLDPHEPPHWRVAQDVLRQAFIDCWPPPYPLRETYANTDEALAAASAGSVIAMGDAASNQITAKLSGSGRLAWEVTTDGRLSDLRTGSPLPHPHAGYVARVAGPFLDGATVVATAATTGAAARAGMELLADPGRFAAAAGPLGVLDHRPTAQFAYATDPATGALDILDVTEGN
nr:PIG-L family deacetylase [Streptomyces coryli]